MSKSSASRALILVSSSIEVRAARMYNVSVVVAVSIACFGMESNKNWTSSMADCLIDRDSSAIKWHDALTRPIW